MLSCSNGRNDLYSLSHPAESYVQWCIRFCFPLWPYNSLLKHFLQLNRLPGKLDYSLQAVFHLKKKTELLQKHLNLYIMCCTVHCTFLEVSSTTLPILLLTSVMQGMLLHSRLLRALLLYSSTSFCSCILTLVLSGRVCSFGILIFQKGFRQSGE